MRNVWFTGAGGAGVAAGEGGWWFGTGAGDMLLVVPGINLFEVTGGWTSFFESGGV